MISNNSFISISVTLIFFLFSFLFSDNSAENKGLKTMLENQNYSNIERFNIYEEISYNFIKDKEFDQAINNYMEAYKELHDKKDLKNEIPEILRNVAYLYQDSLAGNRLENNHQSAIYFKRIVTEFRNSKYAKEALRNAIFNFKLASNYDETLSLIKLYNKLYPKDNISKRYMIERANIYLKLKKEKDAFDLYRDFSASYPQDSLSVEAFYYLGKITLKQKSKRNSINKAKEYFNSSIELSENLKISKENYNKFYFIESLFELTNIQFQEFKKIDFTLPLTSTIKQEYEKNKIYQSLLKKYDQIITYGNKRYSYCLLKKIELLEEYGDTKFNQELDKKNNNIDDIVYRKEVYNLAGKFYEKAIEEYKLSIPLLEEFIKIYTNLYNKKLNHARSIISAYKLNINKRNHNIEDIDNDEIDSKYLSALEIKRELLSDSTLTITKMKLEKAKNSIVRMQYVVASTNRNIAIEYFKIRSDYHEEDSDTYFEKLYFIDNAIIPLVEKIVEAYHKTIKYSSEYKINNEWVGKSINEIGNYSDILSEAYITIVDDVFKTYEKYFDYSFKYAKSKKRQYVKKIGDKILINNDIYEEMTSMIDYAKVASIKSINSFWKNLKESIDSKIISKKLITKIENNLLDFILKTEEKNEKIRKLVIENYAKADSIYWDDTKSNERFYLLADYFQENNEILDELSFMILYEGYEIIKNYKINTSASNQILHKLVQKKPADFINKTNLKTKKISYKTDTKWLATSIFRNDFYRNNYNKSFWKSADIINKHIPKFKIDSSLKKSLAIWTKKLDKNKLSVIKSKTKNNYIPPNALFFRKDFNLKGIPVSGNIDLIVDDFFILIVNETTVIKFSDIEDKDGWRKVRSFNIGKFLKKGKNSLVVIASDNNNIHYGLKANIQIELLKNYNKNDILKLVL